MTTNTVAFFVDTPDPASKAGNALFPERGPTRLWGQGTPDGDRDPFLGAQKGSTYIQVDATDDTSHIWQKVDEGNDDDDWILLEAGAGSISNADIVAAAGIVGSKLAANARRQTFRSKTFNIDNGSGTVDEEACFHAVDDITITAIRRVYTEATDTAGAASALTRIGTSSNGQQIVASVALTAAKAVGSTDTLTIASGVVAAGGTVFVRHTGIAATEVGQYYVQFDYTVDD